MAECFARCWTPDCGLHRRPMVSRSGNGAFASFSEIRESADVVLDFSFHTATESALGFALEHGLPIVIGTTGHTQQERARIERASEQIPVFFPVT